MCKLVAIAIIFVVRSAFHYLVMVVVSRQYSYNCNHLYPCSICSSKKCVKALFLFSEFGWLLHFWRLTFGVSESSQVSSCTLS